MANRHATFLLKRSNVPGKVPPASGVTLGEILLNTADAVLYTSGTTANQILPIGWDRVSKTGDTMTGNLYAPTISATTFSATTYLNLPSMSGSYLPLSGGTVYGATTYSGGLTANTLNVTGLTQTSGITSTGGITFKQVTINSSYTATTSDYMIDISGGTFTVSLPSAVGIQGRLLVIKNNGGGAVTVDPYGSETIDGKPFVVLGETNSLQLASNGVEWVAMSYNISTVNSSSGVFSFTGLTKVTSTTFRVAEVKGWIVDDTTNPLSPQLYYVYYSGGVHTDNYVTTANETFVYLTSGGTISQQSTPLTTTQRRQNIFLGKLGHPDKTSINLVFSQPDFVLSPLSQLRDVFLPINLINGGVYPSVNTGLTFNTSAGYIYGLGINFASDTLNPNSVYVGGTNPCTFQYRTQTGGTITNVTNIDPLNYDVGGVITPITGTKASNQRIFLLQNGTIRVQYGQTTYTTFASAVQGIQTETFTPFPNFINNAVLIGVLTVLSTATDLTDTSKAQFFFASKFGETVGAAGGVSTTTLQQAYNNSSTPEIIINSTLDGLSIKNGTGNADNVTRLFEGLNASGNVTSFIRSDGDISGTTLQTNGFIANGLGVTATTLSATTYYNLPYSGTVTSVSALTLGTTGTDLSSTVSSGTTTPVITLNVPTASATNRGVLSSTDWSTFNSKQGTITLTTTGTTGAATFTGGTLNIPQYAGGLSYFTEAQSTTGVNNTVYVNSLTATGSTTNVDFVIAPKGDGAIIRQIPDGSTNGNKRGLLAVDFQKYPTAGDPTRVASGTYSVILNGNWNTASGSNSTVINGDRNVASGNNSVVSGTLNTASSNHGIAMGNSNTSVNQGDTAIGYSNTATGGYSTAIGYGNTANVRAVALGYSNSANGSYSTAFGGSSNASSTYSGVLGGQGGQATKTHSTVVGGYFNSATGDYSVSCGFATTAGGGASFAGGQSSTASNNFDFAFGNTCNIASGGYYGNVSMGYQNTVNNGLASTVFGNGNIVQWFHQFAAGNDHRLTSTNGSASLGISTMDNGFGRSMYGRSGWVRGDTQSSKIILNRRTTDATASVLVIDSPAGNTPSVSNQITLQNNNVYRVKGSITGKQSGSTNVGVWDIDCVIVRGANAATTTIAGTPTVTLIVNTGSFGTPTLTANTTLGCLTVTVTGVLATNIQWTCMIDTCEVIYA